MWDKWARQEFCTGSSFATVERVASTRVLGARRAQLGAEMTLSVRPWEVQGRRRRRLTVVVMGVLVATCFLAVVY